MQGGVFVWSNCDFKFLTAGFMGNKCPFVLGNCEHSIYENGKMQQKQFLRLTMHLSICTS